MAEADFTRELAILLLDKLAIGVVIVIVGAFASRALERYRTNEAIRQAIVEKRVAIMAPLWTEVNTLHFLVTHRYNVIGLSRSNEKELEVLKKEMEEKETQAILNARANRFWFGEELYNKHMQYLAEIRNLIRKMEEFQEAVRGGSVIEEKGTEMMMAADRAQGAFLYIDDVLRLLTRTGKHGKESGAQPRRMPRLNAG